MRHQLSNTCTQMPLNQVGWDLNTSLSYVVACGHTVTPIRPGYNGATICDISGIGEGIVFPNQHCLIIKYNYRDAATTAKLMLKEQLPFRYKPRYTNAAAMVACWNR